MKHLLLLACLFVFQCCTQSSSKNKVGHQIAAAHGIENFEKAQMIEFVFNVQRDTANPSSRHWQWFPKSNEVVYIIDSTNTRFKRTDTSSRELKKLNGQFTNDEYWLLYPYHLSWDTGFELLDSSMTTAPISGQSLRRITAKYNDSDGFTPGDRYDVYIDENQQIQEWAFHKSGATEPSLVTTWENYKDFNGLQIAQEHKSKDGKFRLWFTGIQVK